MSKKSSIYTKGGDTGMTDLMNGCRMSKGDPRSVAIGTLDELSASLNQFYTEINNVCNKNIFKSFAIIAGYWLATIIAIRVLPQKGEILLALWVVSVVPLVIAVYNKYWCNTFTAWDEMRDLVSHILVDIHNMESCLSVGQHIIDTRDDKKDLNMIIEQVELLEECIDDYDSKLTPLKNFILLHNSRTAASVNVARVICRRAERAIVVLKQDTDHLVVGDILMKYINRLSDLLFVMTRYCDHLEGYTEADQVCVSKRSYNNIVSVAESSQSEEETNEVEEINQVEETADAAESTEVEQENSEWKSSKGITADDVNLHLD